MIWLLEVTLRNPQTGEYVRRTLEPQLDPTDAAQCALDIEEALEKTLPKMLEEATDTDKK